MRIHFVRIASFVRTMGFGRYRRHWPRVPGKWLCCMTYSDYVGYMMSAMRASLNKAFDVIIFDEAFEGTSDVFAAKRAFAAFASADVSLILCSATISKEASGASGADAMGSFKVLDNNLPIEDMMRSGKLMGEYLVDRTYVVLSLDEHIMVMAAYYEHQGIEAHMLDSGASYEELTTIIAALRGDSVSPRIVLMHSKWAIGFNLQLEFALIRPTRSALVDDGGVWRLKEYPMSEEYVTQAMSRTGRGIGDASGGVVLGSTREEAAELYDSDVERAFFLLYAMKIKPGSHARWDACHARYPDGLAPSVAYNAIRSNLPPGIAVMLMGKDGGIARKFVRPINVFAQQDHYLMGSDYEEPVKYADWVMDDLLIPDLGLESRRLVPVRAEGELQVVLHAIAAMADGELELKRWRPEAPFVIGDYESDDGVSGKKPSYVKLRRYEERKALPAVPDAPVLDTSFRLNGPLIGQDKRAGHLFDKDRMRESLVALEATLMTGQVVSSPIEPVATENGEVVHIMGIVESPGGSAVCEMPAKLCETMNEGRVLTKNDFLLLLRTIKRKEMAFASSKLFDGFAGPWESYFRSLLDDEVAACIVRKGEWPLAYEVVRLLRKRFDVETVSVLVGSNLTKSFMSRLFSSKKPRMSSVLRAVDEGRFKKFGQSERFFERLRLLKQLQDRVIVNAEQAGVYLPVQVTEMQRRMQYGIPHNVGAGPGRYEAIPRSQVSGVINGDYSAVRNRFTLRSELTHR